jgi:hypothetical protein
LNQRNEREHFSNKLRTIILSDRLTKVSAALNQFCVH